MKIRYATMGLAILVWGLLSGPVVRAQSAAAARPADTAPSKVGVLNIQVAITTTAEGKQASAELQSQFSPRQTEVENLSKQIDDLRNRLRAGASTLSDDEKARLAREGDQLTRSLQRKQQDFNDDSNEAQREVIDRIGRKMLEVIDRFAKENGYAVIIDTSAQNTPVLYAANQIDITQEIIRRYDAANPVKTAAAPPRPAAARPAPAKPPQR